MSHIKVTREQVKWLNKHGGRNFSDVLEDELGLYVLMGDGKGGEKKYYMPPNDYLNESSKQL